MEKRQINCGEKIEVKTLGKQLGIEDEEYVLIILNDEKSLYFEYCEICWQGKILEVNGFRHIGFSEDTVVISTDLLEKEDLPEVDFRYFARKDNVIEFYMWRTDIERIYIKNNGNEKMIVDTDEDIFIVRPSKYVFRIAQDTGELEEFLDAKVVIDPACK